MKRAPSVLFLISLISLVLSYPVSADIAPPQQPPGFNPKPGNETTQVRMLSETVTIDVQDADPPQAHFFATFVMSNLGDQAEDLAVRFPLATNDGWSQLIEIENIEIRVNDRITAYERVVGPEPIYGFEDEHAPWAQFDVNFPPAENVMIAVAYDLAGTSFDTETGTSFSYILATGAGWSGTIGSGRIILRLPYEATLQNIMVTEWEDLPEFAGREARWSFTDLEPTLADNLTFRIIKPVIWDKAIAAQAIIANYKQNGEAFGQLGEAYRQALFAAPKGYPREDLGSGVLYDMARTAYEFSISSMPDNNPYRIGFAELLLNYNYWKGLAGNALNADQIKGLEQLKQAYWFDPNDQHVLDLIEVYSNMYPEFVWYDIDGSIIFTAPTRTSVPTLMLTSTPRSAGTYPKTVTAASMLIPLFGSLGLILISLFLIRHSHRSGRDSSRE